MKIFPLFPLTNKLEGKLTNALCLKAGECMSVCLDNLLVCNKPCDTLKMGSKLQLVLTKYWTFVVFPKLYGCVWTTYWRDVMC